VPTAWATALHCLSSAHRADSAEESSERKLVLRWVLPTMVAADEGDYPAVVGELT